MLNPATATTTVPAQVAPQALTAFADETPTSGLFTEPVDVSLLEALQVDELGRRRSRWLPADVLL